MRLCIPRVRTWRLILRSLVLALGVLAGTALLAGIFAGAIYQHTDSFEVRSLPPVDVIVCLAGGRGRYPFAAQIWARYQDRAQVDPQVRLPFLYFAGVGKSSNWSSLSRQLLDHDQLIDIPPMLRILEKDSPNTIENARWFRRYALERSWHSALLITSSYHMRRAELVFRRELMGLNLELLTLTVNQAPFNQEQWRKDLYGWQITLREYVKWAYYQRVGW